MHWEGSKGEGVPWPLRRQPMQNKCKLLAVC